MFTPQTPTPAPPAPKPEPPAPKPAPQPKEIIRSYEVEDEGPGETNGTPVAGVARMTEEEKKESAERIGRLTFEECDEIVDQIYDGGWLDMPGPENAEEVSMASYLLGLYSDRMRQLEQAAGKE